MARKSQPDAVRHRPDREYVAELVELAKKRNGYTNQESVAKRIGVGRTTLKEWLSGTAQISYPSQYTLERLAGVV